MEPLIFILLIGVAVAFFAIKQSNKTTSAWDKAASKLRLGFKNEKFGQRQIQGKRGDLLLEITTKQVGKATWTGYQAKFAEALPFTLNLTQQSFFTDVKNAFLNKIDLETGNPAFDQKIIVESRDAEKVRAFLDERARFAILKLLGRFDSFEMTDARIQVMKKRVVSDQEELVDDLRILEASAQKLLESALPSSEPKKVPPPLPKGEPLEDAEVEDPVSEVVEEVVRETASEADTGEELESVFEVISEEAESESNPLEVVASGNSSDFALHCCNLFAECQGHYQMVKVFDEKLKGTEVDDVGILEHAEHYSMDRVFGRGPGIRRMFSLGSLENGDQLKLAMNSPVDVTIREAKEKEGNTDSIQGSFVAFDPFSRTLFVKAPQLDTNPA